MDNGNDIETSIKNNRTYSISIAFRPPNRIIGEKDSIICQGLPMYIYAGCEVSARDR